MTKKIFENLILFFVLLVLFFNSMYGEIPAQERAALIAFYNTTKGDNWDNNTGWKTPPLHSDGFALPGTEGTWFGIEIQDDHVTVINLMGNNLKGPIPIELENLSYLQNLSLSGYTQRPVHSNHLSGNIPPNLGNLIHLQTLDLSSNELTGNIPPELGNLANLVTLDLSWNPFSGTIPQELGNLANLKTLWLSQTPLTGNIPSSFGNLLNLEDLGLYHNQLSGAIPDSLGNLVNLKNLFLSYNPLSGSIPDSFGNLINLSSLLLDQTQISGSIPPSFGNLRSLREAHLSNNQLSGSIPASFGNLANLEFVYLDHNRISGSIPTDFGNLGKLSYADLSYNQLSGSIPPELGNLHNLRYLDLHHNQISGNIPTELGNMYKLSSINLSNNQISGTIPIQLSSITHLKGLNFSNNQLSGNIPSELANLKKLAWLQLQENQLSGNIPPGLGNLKLTSLQLDHNYLSGEIPSDFTNLSPYNAFDIGYNCLYTSNPTLRTWLDIHDPGWETHQNQCEINGGPIININRTQLNFGILTPALAIPISQEVRITNGGGGTLKWTINYDVSWLSVSPVSGKGNGKIVVSIDPAGLSEGTYNGNITITSPYTANSPRTVAVILKVKSQSEDVAPFGEFCTPVDGAIVSGSVPVTGWALDDTGVQDVKIYGGYENNLVYIGDAVFVEGARPDIESAYPDYPVNYKAGWGYMLLTNYLPNGGNGIFKLQAVATDGNGNSSELGFITITADNANAVKPFGYIDTPGPGEVVSGRHYVNFGWALTPQPNYIPSDGSTIDVWIDGIKRGHPKYNNYREDIGTIFPGYANSDGAIGYFYLDTATYENGIHTIAWTVTDSAGNADGIGSRYFTIQNPDNFSYVQSGLKDIPGSLDSIDAIPWFREPVMVKKGFKSVDEFEELLAEKNLNRIILKELERVEIKFGETYSNIQGYLRIDNEFDKLPIGSTLDKKTGTFSWLPGPGFLGHYSLVFILTDSNGQSFRKSIEIEIEPKF